MSRARKRKKGTGARGWSHTWYLAPLLAGALIVLIGCITQRFCVDQASAETRVLHDRLKELSEEVPVIADPPARLARGGGHARQSGVHVGEHSGVGGPRDRPGSAGGRKGG